MRKTILQLIFSLALLLIASCGRDDNGGGSGNSCGQVSNVSFNSYAVSISLSFQAAGNANSYRVEYGPTGFVLGTGKSVVTSNTYVEIKDLNPATTYDFYITSICSSTQSSTPYKLSSVTTQTSQCSGITTAAFYQFDATTMTMQITYSGFSYDHHEVEYGPAGFVPGSGTKLNASGNTLNITSLVTNQTYDFYVRTYCQANDANAFKKYTYTATPSCPVPFQLNSTLISGSCNSGTATRSFSWSSYGNPVSYSISLIQDVNGQPGSVHHTTSNKSVAIGNMFCNWKGFYVRSNCADGSSSAWAGPFIF